MRAPGAAAAEAIAVLEHMPISAASGAPAYNHRSRAYSGREGWEKT